MIPAVEAGKLLGNKPKISRFFNTTGICDPQLHYMVNLDERLEQVRVLADEGKYFMINRARKSGKNTMLHAQFQILNHDYFVVSKGFRTQESFRSFAALRMTEWRWF